MYNEKVPSPRPWHNERLLRAVVIILVLTFILIILLSRNRLPDPSTVGYLGVFILSFVSSASVVIPLPGIAAVCAGASLGGLFPLGVGLMASVAEALGELTGYLIGFSGRRGVENHRFYPRIERWMQRRTSPIRTSFSSKMTIFSSVGLTSGKRLLTSTVGAACVTNDSADSIADHCSP